MEKIFILGNSSDSYANELGIKLIELPIMSTDEDIDTFIQTRLLSLEFDCLIISLQREDISLGLRLGLHVRLTESLKAKRLASLLFISTALWESVLMEAGAYAHILATKGCRYAQYKEKEKILLAAKNLPPLPIESYKSEFLDIIKIEPDEKMGKHSLANQWGALSLERAAKTRSLPGNVLIEKAQKRLYFKYVLSLNDNYSSLKIPGPKLVGWISLEQPDQIEALDRKILFIDDEAEKGWAEVLRAIFKVSSPADFHVIHEKVKDYDSLSQPSKDLIEKGDFDLFLVDLRLNGFEEENVSNPEDFSGAKVIKKIKELNAGNQVIMFTASNKAWNMKSLNKSGIDGYYIKESPEYNFNKKFSEENYQNFKVEASLCLQLWHLRDIYRFNKRWMTRIDNAYGSKSRSYQQFFDRTKAALQIAFDLLKRSVIEPNNFNLAYLTYYQIIEDFAGQLENFKYYSRSEAYVNEGNSRVIDTNGSVAIVWELKFVPDSEGGYFIKQSAIPTKDIVPTTLAKVSFILAFNYGKDDNFLLFWAGLNNLRNKAAHGGDYYLVTKKDIFDLLEIIDMIF